MCGEQRILFEGEPDNGGSPPRVRGTDGLGTKGDGGTRITPACAGNRQTNATGIRAQKDHPRVCGEQFSKHGTRIPVTGSPPRVRGTASWERRMNHKMGITPACAGNRVLFGRVGKEDEDHPRVCGEQLQSCSWQGGEGDHPRVCGEQT